MPYKLKLKNLLSISDLDKDAIYEILRIAQEFVDKQQQNINKFSLLHNKTIANLFFEPSTRTRTTFELAAKRLGADVININIDSSATKKGESLLDTLRNLEAMYCDMFIIRHSVSGAANFIANIVGPKIRVVNGGDGCHAHPTQALLDMLTIQQHKKTFQNLKVAIVGDILHSRVARSLIAALTMLDVDDIRAVGPKTLLPDCRIGDNVSFHYNLRAGIANADVIIILRLQNERMQSSLLSSSHEYFQSFGLTLERLKFAAPDAMIMHPGPINRGVEISSSVADHCRSVILQQVSNGISLRMAIISILFGKTL